MKLTNTLLISSIIILLSIVIWREYYHYNEKGSITNKNIVVSKEKESIVVHSDKSLKSLKQGDRPLYDSISKYGDKVETVYKVKYIYKHTTDTLYLDTLINKPNTDRVYTFTQKTDTISTEILVKGVEVKWVKVDTHLRDSLTIVNLREKNNNITHITSKLNSTINPETVWHRKEKFLERFSIGPSVGVGYGLMNKNIDLFAGITITYKL